MKSKSIRQPIVTVVGHVDHGKTSILDKLRESYVQKGEKGGITQKISFTLFPMEQLKAVCPPIREGGISLDIPGFLFIDTPGHAAFINLRKRGGSLADLAVLVIDINDGIKPQTAEVIQILKRNKTPFVIALNKIDNISGWRKQDENLQKSIEMQSQNVRQNFDEKYMTLIGSLNSFGFDADLFYKITDFKEKVALVPCSAQTGEGISDLMMVLCGLSQKYLQNKLEIGKDAKGIVLEVKQEKACTYLEVILYDGEMSKKEDIAVSNIDGKPIITQTRILEEIEPLSSKFRPVEKARASTGLRMQLCEKVEILPGMPFMTYKNNEKEIEKEFKKEISENIQTQKQGIVAKADSLGSLEALLLMLKENNISVLRAGIGNINKKDVICAKANLEINELDAIVIGFNVEIDAEAKDIQRNIKIFREEVIYKLIEDLVEFRIEKKKEIEKERLTQLANIAKIKILPQFVFRNTSPAIFGVRVEGGKIVPGLTLIDSKGEKAGKIKKIQSENKSVDHASEGMEVAISIPGSNFERKLKDKDFLYSDMGESHFRNFKKNKDLLSANEKKVLQEIAEIKRQEKDSWGT